MKRFLLLFPLFTLSIGTATAGETPFNYFNLNFGVGNYKSPLIYTYSLEVCRDIKISKHSSFLIGLEWENFYKHLKYDFDTNFIAVTVPTEPNVGIAYNETEKIMLINLTMAYKYWLKKTKTNSLYLQTEINYNFVVRKISKAHSYYRDSSQTLYLGPFSSSFVDEDHNKTFIPDYINPAFSIGYLKNIKKNLAYHFKLEINFAIPEYSPENLALVYPVASFGLAFR